MMATDKKEAVGQVAEDAEILRRRRLPVGAEVVPHRGVHFRVWANGCQHLTVVLETAVNARGPELAVALMPERNGYFSGLVASAGAGMLYRYRVEDTASLYPDPASRFQPHGPHGPSQV